MLAALARSARIAWSRETANATPSHLPAWATTPQSRGKKKKSKGRGSGGGSGNSNQAAVMDVLSDAAVDLSPFENNMRTTVDGLRTTYSRIRSATTAPEMLDGKLCHATWIIFS